MKGADRACSIFLRAVVVRMKELGLTHTTLENVTNGQFEVADGKL